MSGISCSQCDWVSESTNTMEAENEFTEHAINGCHNENVEKIDPRIHKAIQNINIDHSNGRYTIFISGGRMGACGRSRILDFPELMDIANEDKNIINEDEAIIIAKQVSNRLNLSIHLTIRKELKCFYVKEIL